MEPFYGAIKNVHIAAALTSGALFLIRGLAINFMGARWAMASAVRYLSWTVDTVLLTAALMLMTVIDQYPGVTPWLTVKVLLVVVYVALGWFALGRARSRRASVALWGLALLVFGFIYTIARAHNPLGLFAA